MPHHVALSEEQIERFVVDGFPSEARVDVHTAQPLRGRVPRFLAQPPLPRVPLDPWRENASPVERAIRFALEK